MEAVYYIEFEIKTDTDKINFRKAFVDIFTLSKALILSNDNKKVRDFITWLEPDDYWLNIDEQNQRVSINAEHCENIALSKGDNAGVIKYNFGKELPGKVEYFGAFMAIICHYFPAAIIGPDAKNHIQQFEDGVLLAKLVIKDVKNPLLKDGIRLVNDYVPSQQILAVCEAVRVKCKTVLTLTKPILTNEKSENLTEEKARVEAVRQQQIGSAAAAASSSSTVKTASGGARRKNPNDNNDGEPSLKKTKDGKSKDEKSESTPPSQAYKQHGAFSNALSPSVKTHLRENTNQQIRLMFNEFIQETVQAVLTTVSSTQDQKRLLDNARLNARKSFLELNRNKNTEINTATVDKKTSVHKEREKRLVLMEEQLEIMRKKLIASGDSESMINKTIEEHRAFAIKVIDQRFPSESVEPKKPVAALTY